MDFSGNKLNEEQQQQLLFMMLVQQHEQIGMMGMGKLKDPSTDAINRDMHAARYAIDTLQMIEKFMAGNLTDDMKRYLQHVLTNLRLNYADEVKSDKEKEKSSNAPAAGSGESAETGKPSESDEAGEGDNPASGK